MLAIKLLPMLSHRSVRYSPLTCCGNSQCYTLLPSLHCCHFDSLYSHSVALQAPRNAAHGLLSTVALALQHQCCLATLFCFVLNLR